MLVDKRARCQGGERLAEPKYKGMLVEGLGAGDSKAPDILYLAPGRGASLIPPVLEKLQRSCMGCQDVVRELEQDRCGSGDVLGSRYGGVAGKHHVPVEGTFMALMMLGRLGLDKLEIAEG